MTCSIFVQKIESLRGYVTCELFKKKEVIYFLSLSIQSFAASVIFKMTVVITDTDTKFCVVFQSFWWNYNGSTKVSLLLKSSEQKYANTHMSVLFCLSYELTQILL